MKTLAALVFIACFQTFGAMAVTSCYMPYYDFEEMVPHKDIEVCPGFEVDLNEGFCRISIVADTITVYEFEIGEKLSCLVGAKAYTITEFIEQFGYTYEFEDE